MEIESLFSRRLWEKGTRNRNYEGNDIWIMNSAKVFCLNTFSLTLLDRIFPLTLLNYTNLLLVYLLACSIVLGVPALIGSKKFLDYSYS